MADGPKILELLREDASDAADAIMMEAIQYVDDATQLRIVDTLIERGRDVGLGSLPDLYDQLNATGRGRVVGCTSRLFAALRKSIRHRRVQTRSNTLRIVRDSGNLRLAYLVAMAMNDASPRIRSEAAAVLLRLADEYRRRHREITESLRESLNGDEDLSDPIVKTLSLLRDERQFLVSALHDALKSFDSHHRIDVVEAAMCLGDDLGSILVEDATARRGKLMHALLEVFANRLSPRLAPFAYLGLSVKEMRGKIADTLARCRDAGFMAEFIRYSWMARDPSIARALRSIRGLAVLDDELEFVFGLPAAVCPLMPAWLLSLGVPSDVKVSVLNHVFLLDNPEAHRAATWAIASIHTPGSTQALQIVADGDDRESGRLAEFEIEHRRRMSTHDSNVPAGRPESWRRLLQSARISEEFDELWEHFERIDPVLARDAGHHAVSHVPGFTTRIRAHMLGRRVEHRRRALRIVLTLRVTQPFRNEIYGLAQDRDDPLRTACMTALGELADAASRRILERGLDDPAPAVQAAAIDGLRRMKSDHRADRIERMCDADEPEVRSSAVRAMIGMRRSEGAAGLLSMLNDPRPRHRSEALKLVDRLNLAPLTNRIVEIANTDRDPRIARMAVHVLKRLHRRRQEADAGVAAGAGAA